MKDDHPFKEEFDREVEVRQKEHGVMVTGLPEVASFDGFKETLQKLSAEELVQLLMTLRAKNIARSDEPVSNV